LIRWAFGRRCWRETGRKTCEKVKITTKVQSFQNKDNHTYGTGCWTTTGGASGDSSGEATGGCVGVLVGNEVRGTGVGRLRRRENDRWKNKCEKVMNTKKNQSIQNKDNHTYGTGCWTTTGDASGDSSGEATGGCVGVLVGNEVRGTGVGRL
jgi:hypothetical protein